jgi:two-component system, NtrC family, sensor histidine kinase HydH
MVEQETQELRTVPVLARLDLESFRQREMVFATLNLFVLAALLLLHSLFSSLLGPPSPALLVTLGAAFLFKMLELFWLWASVRTLSRVQADIVVWISICLNMALALLLTFFTNQGNSPYFVLLALPVLQAAYRFRLPTCISVIVVADSITFFWVWHFAKSNPPIYASEYLEAGVISVVYALMGLLVWLLVNQLRGDQRRLADNLRELERTRERLMVEEKLAVVGRLSSAMAHEIRNPVSIIASSLVTADRPEVGEQQRKEMLAIARIEAARLERLTSDFLSYARPNQPKRNLIALADVLGYIAEIANVQASKRGIRIAVEGEDGLRANVDREQLQRALLNLLLNAIDATPVEGHVALRCSRPSAQSVELQIENSGDPIPEEVLSRIFEPFYTTKSHGTGLGLAISRNIARVQGGDLVVTRNDPGHVCFAMTVSDGKPVGSGAISHG